MSLLWRVDNFASYPHAFHIFSIVMHISIIVLDNLFMLQYFRIKQNADLIKSFYALGVIKNASELQDESVEEIQVDEIEYEEVVIMLLFC